MPSCDPAGGETRRAREWNGLSIHAVVVRSVTPQVVAGGGDPLIGRALEPAALGVPRCTPQEAADQPGVATYRSAPFGPAGALLIGSPEVTATLTVLGAPAEHAQVAARLWDLDPGAGTQRLVSRTLYRPAGTAVESFRLHGTAYRFAPGHIAKLELLTQDAPYGRPSNLPFAVSVSGLSLRLPLG